MVRSLRHMAGENKDSDPPTAWRPPLDVHPLCALPVRANSDMGIQRAHLDIHSIKHRPAEGFYWVPYSSNSQLGTAAGDA